MGFDQRRGRWGLEDLEMVGGKGREGAEKLEWWRWREWRGEEIVDTVSVRDGRNEWRYRRSCILVSLDIPTWLKKKKRREDLYGLY